jgi:hypothetical protein
MSDRGKIMLRNSKDEPHPRNIILSDGSYGPLRLGQLGRFLVENGPIPKAVVTHCQIAGSSLGDGPDVSLLHQVQAIKPCMEAGKQNWSMARRPRLLPEKV